MNLSDALQHISQAGRGNFQSIDKMLRGLFTGGAAAPRERIIVVDSDTALTLTEADHAGALIVIDRAAGVDFTLPLATGSGAKFRFFIATTVTLNDITFTCAGADAFFGVLIQLADGGATLAAYEGAGSTVITLNGGTKGGIKGDIIELVDAASGVWMLDARTSATGVEATPLS